MKNYFYFLMLLAISSCSSDLDNDTNVESRDRSRNDDVITISYEMKTTTVVDVDGESSTLDRFATNPLADHSKIDMTVRGDGSVKMTTEKVIDREAPDFSVAPRRRSSENPKTYRTVHNGDKLIRYDINGKRIGKPTQATGLNLSSLVETIMSLPPDTPIKQQEIIKACMKENVKLDTLIKYLSNPPQGVKVKKITDKIMSVAMPLPSRAKGGGQPTLVSHVVNIDQMMVLGTKLFGEDGKPMMCMLYRYKDCLLKGFKQETFQTLPSGEELVSTVYAEIEDFKFEIH